MKYLLTLPDNAAESFYGVETRSEESWFVTSDPQGKKIGSGGGTANLLAEAYFKSSNASFDSWVVNEKKIVIHAGGESRRLPAYAHTGKILAPIPVFRWGRGQAINQNLLDIQLPLLEEIMASTNRNQNTLIASGDVLIRNSGGLPSLPDADVICFGLWGSPEKAANHGVFFTPADGSGKLSFMLQKPTNSQIAEHCRDYHYLLDIGIWVLSDRAVKCLMDKCGWNPTTKGFEGGIPKNYDLYSEFGLALGENPTAIDDKLADLSVALITLENGEFYHFGRNSELIESTERLQNLVVDQREIWHKKVKPHPSIFIQNCDSSLALNSTNQHLWFENSYLPSSWKISNSHILTGIPQNSWSLTLPAGVCLDVAPIHDDLHVIRPYGFNDEFKGDVCAAETRWLNRPLGDWFAKRNISIDGKLGVDIQQYPLFPVISINDVDGGFVEWLVSDEPAQSEEYKRLYLSSERISASQICARANLKRLYDQREELMVQAIPQLAKNYRNSVFYQLDLDNLAKVCSKKNLALPEVDGVSGMQKVSDLMLRSRIGHYGGAEDGYEQEAFGELQRCVLKTHTAGKVHPKLSVKDDQIVWGRSPLRIDIGGGWSDTPPYCFSNGGAVVNVAIEINGQPPIQVFVKPSEERRIVISSIDLGAKEVILSFEELEQFNIVGSPFSIPKAALCLAGFHGRFSAVQHQSLQDLLDDFGSGIEISILSAVPKGSGLGTSSILAATVLGTLSNFCGLEWDKLEICSKTLALEQLLTTGGGWQDQVGGVLHGVKLIETTPGFEQTPVVRWLPTDLFDSPQTKGTFLLYYTGITRTAKNILAEIVRGMFLNSSSHLNTLGKIKQHASDVFESIMRGDHALLASSVAKSWKLNMELDSGTCTPDIVKIVEPVSNDLLGFKLLGAGGGGFMLMVAKDLDAAARVRGYLEANPINSKARFVEMTVSKTGFLVTRS